MLFPFVHKRATGPRGNLNPRNRLRNHNARESNLAILMLGAEMQRQYIAALIVPHALNYSLAFARVPQSASVSYFSVTALAVWHVHITPPQLVAPHQLRLHLTL
jgi:hypothetical protein